MASAGFINECRCISSNRSTIFIASVCSVETQFSDVLNVPFQTIIMMFVVKCFFAVLALNMGNFEAVFAELAEGTRVLELLE